MQFGVLTNTYTCGTASVDRQQIAVPPPQRAPSGGVFLIYKERAR